MMFMLGILKNNKILFILIVMFGLALHGLDASKCYLNDVICQKDVDYNQKPIISLYKRDRNGKDGFSIVMLPESKKGFYIAAKEKESVLYTAYQVYQNDYSCPVHDYIEPAKVSYKLEFFKISIANDKKIEIAPLQESIPNELKSWSDSLSIDENKSLICEEGEISYSSWTRKF